VTALEYTELRVLSQMAHGGQPGPEVSGLKVRGSEIQQRITELTMEAVGEICGALPAGTALAGLERGSRSGPATRIRWRRAISTRARPTIYGGSNEIQKGIISRWCWGFDHNDNTVIPSEAARQRGAVEGPLLLCAR